MIAAFRMSLLSAQRQGLAAVFAQRHSQPWLVWEIATVAPDRTKPQSLVDTAMPPDKFIVPLQADPVCFELRGDAIQIGRTPENDLVMLDATVSRHQLQLRLVGGRYVAGALPDASPVLISGLPLALGAAVALHSGDRLRIGGTDVTYLSAEDLVRRLDAFHAERHPR